MRPATSLEFLSVWLSVQVHVNAKKIAALKEVLAVPLIRKYQLMLAEIGNRRNDVGYRARLGLRFNVWLLVAALASLAYIFIYLFI